MAWSFVVTPYIELLYCLQGIELKGKQKKFPLLASFFQPPYLATEKSFIYQLLKKGE